MIHTTGVRAYEKRGGAVKALLRKLAKGISPGIMRYPTFDSRLHEALPHSDYVRYATIGLALQRILDEHIPGNLAEVGVFRGNMSRFIHALTPDRPYYLFDTFAGFPKSDLEPGVAEDARFDDTSVELVLRNIGDTRNIHIRQGYVPDTFGGLEQEAFAFVLLDVDLYPPTLAGLRFFYPRLSAGGYIVLHDYNSPESNHGVKRATDEFMRGKPEKIVELADLDGTVLFRKSSG